MKRSSPTCALLCLLFLAAAPATRPEISQENAPIKDIPGLLREVPVEMWPAKGKDWTKLQQQLMDKWLSENIAGRRFTAVAKFRTAEIIKTGKIQVYAIAQDAKQNDKNVLGRFYVTFSPESAKELQKYNEDTMISFDGKIIRCIMTTVNQKALVVDVTVDSAKIVPAPRK
jgi:hypothetical protein